MMAPAVWREETPPVCKKGDDTTRLLSTDGVPAGAKLDEPGTSSDEPAVVPVTTRAPRSKAYRFARCALVALLVYAFCVYAALLLLLAAPSAQALLICLHTVKFFVRADFSQPAAAFVLGARDLTLSVPAGAGSGPGDEAAELGMWHVLPSSLAALAAGADEAAGGERAGAASALFDAALFSESERAQPAVILFLHGNGEHRAMHQGPIHARAISSVLQSHAVLLDYRGFGDSSGWPSEEGLARDARAAWDWLTVQRKVPPSRILIWGHSLGSGVAARLAAELVAEAAADADATAAPKARGQGTAGSAIVDQLPLGIVLESGFTSLPDLLPDYPLGRAVCWLPGVLQAMRANLAFQMDSRARLTRLAKAAPALPILLLHGVRDITVPAAHSRALLSAALSAGAQRASLVEVQAADHHTVLASDAALLAAGELIQGGAAAALGAASEVGRRSGRGRGSH